jgi:hypothetical protein
MAHRMSRVEAQLQERLAQLPPDSERYGVLSAARKFKASWVALGQLLVAVRENSAHTDWGYPTFEAYCRRELNIKQETANKLTRSFAFLRDHAPSTLAGDTSDARAPALDVVDLLSQAQERTKVSAEALAGIGQELLSQDKTPTRSAVLKRLRQDDPDAFRPAPKAVSLPTAGPVDQDLRKALLLAERLDGLLQAQGERVSAAARQRMQSVTTELREAFGRVKPAHGTANA